MRMLLSNLVALALLLVGGSTSFADDDKPQDDADSRVKTTVVQKTIVSGTDAEAALKKLEEDLKSSKLSEEHQKEVLRVVGDALKGETEKFSGTGTSVPLGATVDIIEEDGTSVRMRALGSFNEITADEMKIISEALSPSRNMPSHLIGLGFAQSEADNAKGIKVTHVTKGLPADKAGVKVGDLIVSVNGKSVENANEAVSAIQSAGKDDKPVTLKWVRGEARMEADMKAVSAETVEKSSISPIEVQRVFSSVPLHGVDSKLAKQLDELTKEIKSLREEIENLKKK